MNTLLQRLFKGNPRKNTASIAKERLKIIVAHEHERGSNSTLDFLPKLQREIIEVISKYVEIDIEQVKVDLDQAGSNAVLELNITLPEKNGDKVVEKDTAAVAK